MSLPFLSCICITAGRTEHLAEAVACFVRQDYDGESELVILNTLPEQELSCSVPFVTVYNLKQRPESLGAARNIAVAMSSGTHIITFDDDDLYLRNHLSNFGNHFKDNDWLWLSNMFYVEQSKIKNIVRGSQNVVAFTKSAWEAVGCYSPKFSVGEDRDFVGRLTSAHKGVKVQLESKDISFLYAWGNGVWHLSGRGDDKPGQVNSWQRSGEELQRRIRSGVIPTGKIEVKPHLRHDYEKLAADFVAAKAKDNERCLVCLGKIGDVINALPIAANIAAETGKPHFMVSHKYAHILEGVSYVIPHPVPLDVTEFGPALKLAKGSFRAVINAQWGTTSRKTGSFNRESWYNAGFNHLFDNKGMLPVFDRRDTGREQALFNKLDVPGKPMLVFKLSGSNSSPFAGESVVKQAIYSRFSDKFNLIDLNTVKAEKLYDLLGLFDRSAAVLTIDTAIVHLAAASATAFVALVNDKPWFGTLPRGNCVARMPYLEAQAVPQRVVEAVERAITSRRVS